MAWAEWRGSILAARVRWWGGSCDIWSGRSMAGWGRQGLRRWRCICRPGTGVGWDAEQRRAHLHRVAGLSRYLIRPGVACRNLTSHVLGLVLRRLSSDFGERYGFSPYLVDTFVDGTTHSGASLRAANWRLLGETTGRGRQDRSQGTGADRTAPTRRRWGVSRCMYTSCSRTGGAVWAWGLRLRWPRTRWRRGKDWTDPAGRPRSLAARRREMHGWWRSRQRWGRIRWHRFPLRRRGAERR